MNDLADVLYAIEIANSKVSIMVARPNEKKAIQVISYQTVKNEGMKDGLIVDVEKTILAIKNCQKLVKSDIGYSISQAYLLVNANPIISLSSKGIAKIQQSKVSFEDIENAKELSQAFNFPSSAELLHCIVQKYLIDGKKVLNPIDIFGVRLEIDCLLVAINRQILDNLNYCLDQCDIAIQDAVITPYASSLSILNKDDRNMGVIMIDMGYGLNNIAIYKDFALTYLDAIPLAGEKITKRIAEFFCTSIEEAEKLKINYGCVNLEEIENPNDLITIFSNRRNESTQNTLGEVSSIVENCYTQCFLEIKNLIKENCGIDNFYEYAIVLTGQSAAAPGIESLAKKIFDCEIVRHGLIDSKKINLSGIDLNTSSASSLAGVMIYANQSYYNQDVTLALSNLSNRKQDKKKTLNLFNKLKNEF